MRIGDLLLINPEHHFHTGRYSKGLVIEIHQELKAVKVIWGDGVKHLESVELLEKNYQRITTEP